MAEASAERALPAPPSPASSQSVVARVHKTPAPPVTLTPQIEGLVQRAQSDPAAAVTAWDVLSWCDGQEQKRLDNAKGQVESGRRRVERFGTDKARQRLRDAEQWHAEVASQVELCSAVGRREQEALAHLEYAVAAGSDVALERAVFDLMPRMSSAAKVRNAEQLLRIRHHVEKHLLSQTVSDVRQLELLQSGYATGLLAPDPVNANGPPKRAVCEQSCDVRS